MLHFKYRKKDETHPNAGHIKARQGIFNYVRRCENGNCTISIYPVEYGKPLDFPKQFSLDEIERYTQHGLPVPVIFDDERDVYIDVEKIIEKLERDDSIVGETIEDFGYIARLTWSI